MQSVPETRCQSLLVWTASAIGFLLAMQNLQMFEKYAVVLGLPEYEIGVERIGATLVVLLILLLVVMWLHVTVHELGHALAALLVGFRIDAINAGPLTLLKQRGRYRIRFDWRGMFCGGGYLGARPTSRKGVRSREIIVVAAGPLTSLSLGLGLWISFFFLAGTPVAPYWHVFAIGSVMGFYACLINLIPSGNTDGSILFHLVFRTRRGDDFIASLLARQLVDDRACPGGSLIADQPSRTAA